MKRFKNDINKAARYGAKDGKIAATQIGHEVDHDTLDVYASRMWRKATRTILSSMDNDGTKGWAHREYEMAFKRAFIDAVTA